MVRNFDRISYCGGHVKEKKGKEKKKEKEKGKKRGRANNTF